MLCAGSIGSPQILQLSGIGPAALLQQHGIAGGARRCPASAPTCRTTCRSARCSRSTASRTLNTLADSWWGKARIGLEYALKRSGPMSMAPSQLGRLHAQLARRSPTRTSNTTCSR